MDKQPDKSHQNRHAMKSNIRLLTVIPALALTVCVVASAETTNLFETIESTAVSSGRSYGLRVPKLDGHAVGPAKEDSEGNWGAVAGGPLLSLRFEKPLYEEGEPVEAMVLLRNATNSMVRYRERLIGGGASRDVQVSVVEFLVTNETTHSVLEARWGDTYSQHYESFPLPPLQQVFYVNRLDQILNLQPGHYSVQATTRLIVGLGPSSPPLASGAAHITIVKAPAGPKGHGTLGAGTNSPAR
jgi:hypothetical protein